MIPRALQFYRKKENNAHKCTVSAIQAARSERRKKGAAGNRRAIIKTLQGIMGERMGQQERTGRKSSWRERRQERQRRRSEAGERLTVLGNRSRN